MQKRWLAVFLALLVLLLAGCSTREDAKEAGSGETASGYPIVEEPLTLTAFQFEMDNQAVDFSNLWFYEELEKKTGIHIEFEEIKESDWSTKLSLMFASGDYSDLLLRGELDVEEYGVTQGLLVALDEYLPECMPIYSERLRLDGAGDSIPASDGKSYYVGFLIAQDINANGHFFINRAWLDKLDLPVPRTVDELTDTLRAFRDGDPNGNGVADEVPYQATFNDNNTGVYNAFAFFGVPLNPQYVYLEGETVRFAPDRAGFRACVEWLHLLYAEGLLAPAFFTEGQSLWGANLNLGTTGFFTYWRLTNTALEAEIAAQYECMLPVAAEGTRAIVSRTLELPDVGAALTASNRHIRESLRWLDAQMETETMLISQNGYLDDMLVRGEDGKYQVAYVPGMNDLYTFVPVICGQFFAPASYYTKVYEMAAHRLEKAAYCDWYEREGVLEATSFETLTEVAIKTPEQSARLVKLQRDIERHVMEAVVGFIVQGVTDAGWEAYVEALEDIGAAEYTALYQAAYDAHRGAP